jgi:hypothetical protein
MGRASGVHLGELAAGMTHCVFLADLEQAGSENNFRK